MPSYYLRSTDGLATDTGLTWALAKAQMVDIAAIDAAGDVVYISQVHAETTAAPLTLAFAGTIASPVIITTGNDAAEPPTATASSASIATTGASNLTLNGSLYMQGVTLNCGNAAVNFANLRLNYVGQNYQHYENCAFNLIDTHPNGVIAINSEAGGDSNKTRLTNCTIKLNNSGQKIMLSGSVNIVGGSLGSGSVSPSSSLFSHASVGKELIALIEGFDFTNLGATAVLIQAPAAGAAGRGGRVTLRNCKLPAAWTGTLLTGTINSPGWRAEMINCDNGNTNYKLWIEECAGVIRNETVVVKTGGATDGTTPLSWRMASSVNAVELTNPLASPPIVVWNDISGVAKTVSVEIVHDSATALTDAEVWLEVQQLGTTGFPLSINVTDRRTTCLTAPAAQTVSTAPWTTTGLTTPNRQIVSVTFTPASKGPFNVVVMLGKPSKTIYVDPIAQVV